MKLRSCKSEYQHCYASIDEEDFKKIYEEQLTYRAKRREQEMGHMIIEWNSDSDDAKINSNGDVHEHLTEELSSNGADVTEHLSQTTLGEDETGESKEDAYNNPSSKDANYKMQDTKENQTKKKCSTNKSHVIKCKQNQLEEANKERRPFVNYGWADKTTETGRKKTHNVYASPKSVYPAALKCVHYRTLERKKRKERSVSRPASALALSKKKNEEASVWLSEYQRCYSRQSSRPSTACSIIKKASLSRSATYQRSRT